MIVNDVLIYAEKERNGKIKVPDGVKKIADWAFSYSLYTQIILPDSLEEKQILCSTEVYRQIHHQWEILDTALVNIGDYPSSPDFASLVRYILKRCPNIIGVCSANTSAKALGGALKSGFFTHIVARQELLRGLLE